MPIWNVEIKKKVQRRLAKLPGDVQEKALALAIDLRNHGKNPGKNWKNFSPLSNNTFHCHLSYSYVACWEVINEKIRLMEVYYVGSREDAPY
jgi:mRNA-degrading endonuclease RelE of RelBE toxin-antitoxin system